VGNERELTVAGDKGADVAPRLKVHL
jgi:hypothetical protein